MYGKSYGHAGTMSSSGDKMKYKSGGSDSRDPYKTDMYDAMVDLRNHRSLTKKAMDPKAGPEHKSASAPMKANAIQGSVGHGTEGQTQDKSSALDASNLAHGKDYGKGAPYAKGEGKGLQSNTSAKPVAEKKQVAQPGKKPRTFKSIAELRSYGESLKS